MARRYFTEWEDGYIRKMWHRKSLPYIAKRLDRRSDVVCARAREYLGLGDHGVPKGYVKLRELSNTSSGAKYLEKLARRDGVLYQGDWYRAPRCVPEKWMERYLDRQLEKARVDDMARTEGWLSGADIARELGVHPETFSSAMRFDKSSIYAEMKDVERRDGYHLKHWYEPVGARMAIAKLTASRHRRAA